MLSFLASLCRFSGGYAARGTSPLRLSVPARLLTNSLELLLLFGREIERTRGTAGPQFLPQKRTGCKRE